jgi:transposase
MKYIKINNETKEALKEVIKTDPRYRSRIRAQAFLLNSEGIKIPEIAKLLNVSQRTLYRWFDRFDNENVDSIHELKGRVRKSSLKVKEHKESIKILVKKTLTKSNIY